MASNGLGGAHYQSKGASDLSSQQHDGAARDQQPQPAAAAAQIEAWAREHAAPRAPRQPASSRGGGTSFRPQPFRRPQQHRQPHEAAASAEDSSASDDTAAPTAFGAAATDRGNSGAAEQGAQSGVRFAEPSTSRIRVRFAAQPQHRADLHHHAHPHVQHSPEPQSLRPQQQPPQQQPVGLQQQLQQAQSMYRQRQQQLQDGLPQQPGRKRPALSAGAAEFRPGEPPAGDSVGAAAAATVGAAAGSAAEADACVICCEPAEVIHTSHEHGGQGYFDQIVSDCRACLRL